MSLLINSLTTITTDFKWSNAPLNSLYPVVISTSIYVLVVILYSKFQIIRNVIRITNQDFLNSIIRSHNLILSIGSLIMLIGIDI